MSLDGVLLLAQVKDGEGLLGGLDAGQGHGAKGRAHAVGAVDLAELHAADDEAGDDLAGALDDGVLGGAHVEAAHSTELLERAHGHEALGREGAKGAVVARRADEHGRVDGRRVHAGLVVVVHGDQGPVGHDAGDADAARRRVVAARDEVLDRRRVEQLDVGERQHPGQQRRREEGRVLDDDVVLLHVIGHANLLEEGVGRLAHDHCAEELTAQPGTAAYMEVRI